jgi:AraC-like DNA-binding protein
MPQARRFNEPRTNRRRQVQSDYRQFFDTSIAPIDLLQHNFDGAHASIAAPRIAHVHPNPTVFVRYSPANCWVGGQRGGPMSTQLHLKTPWRKSQSRKPLAPLTDTAGITMEADIATTSTRAPRAAAIPEVDFRRQIAEAVRAPRRKGELTAWQGTLVRSYIDSHLSSSISTTTLATLVQLSSGHFSRSFRYTFGETPREYIMRRRVLFSQRLMMDSRSTLAQVALEAGLHDQSHFCRTFRRIVGATPGAWRRALRALSGATG